MKTIRSEMQLELEQAKLRLREVELEKAIRKDWKEIKKNLQPKNLNKGIIVDLVAQKLKNKFKGLLN